MILSHEINWVVLIIGFNKFGILESKSWVPVLGLKMLAMWRQLRVFLNGRLLFSIFL